MFSVQAELRAYLTSLYIGNTLHRSIFLKIDCAFVYSFLANEKLDRSPLVDMKKEALSIFRRIQNYKIVKINRLANEVAHEIVKFSFISGSDGIPFNTVSPIL